MVPMFKLEADAGVNWKVARDENKFRECCPIEVLGRKRKMEEMA